MRKRKYKKKKDEKSFFVGKRTRKHFWNYTKPIQRNQEVLSNTFGIIQNQYRTRDLFATVHQHQGLILFSDSALSRTVSSGETRKIGKRRTNHSIKKEKEEKKIRTQ